MVKEQKDGQLYFDFDNNPIDFKLEALQVHTEYLKIREMIKTFEWSLEDFNFFVAKANRLLEVRENLYRMVL